MFLVKDQFVQEARAIGAEYFSKPRFAVHSITVEINKMEFTIFPNGDVDAPDGYRYQVAMVANNGLVEWKAGA